MKKVYCCVLTALLIGCTPTLTPAPTPPTTVLPTKPPTPSVKVLRLGRAAFPDVLDPQKSVSGNEIEVLRLCYEGLTALDPSGNIIPGSADKYEPVKNGEGMVFHIRESLKRADGTPMNASDFEYALRRAVDPRITGKQYTDLVLEIQGAGALIDAEGKKLSDDEFKKMYDALGVKADDSKRELTVTFTSPIGFWAYNASSVVAFSPDKKSVDAAPDNWWTKAEGHNCNGPFKIKSIEEGKRIVYEANPNYWRGRPKLDRIEATYIPNELQRLEAYKNGESDEIDVTPITLSAVLSDPKLQTELVRYPTAITTILAFNNARKPFDDKNVRIAFSQSLDREGWVREIGKGIGKPYTRWLPPGVQAAQPDKPGIPPSDPKVAVETLIKGGYGTPDGKKVDCAKLGDIKIAYGTSPKNQLRLQFLSDNFSKVFGCPVTLTAVDPALAVALNRDPKTNAQFSVLGWYPDFPHPQNWLSFYWKCAAFAKRYTYCNKNLDELLTKADQTLEFDQAVKLYQQAEDLMLSDVPGAPIMYSEALFLVKPYLVGLKENPSSSDLEWPGEWGPVWTYDIDLGKAPK